MSNYPIPKRQASATALPFAGNNFMQASYSFVLTTVHNGKSAKEELTLVVNPEDFRQSESSTSNVVLTAGDVFSDTFGPGLTKIQISGTFGQRPSAGSGSGQLEVMRLRQFFRKYLDAVNPIINDNYVSSAGAKLQFFNPKDNEFWDIEIPGDYLVVMRSKTAPFMYRYQLRFIGMTPSSHAGVYDGLRVLTNVVDRVTDIQGNLGKLLGADLIGQAQNMSTMAVSIGLGASYMPNQVVAPLTNLYNSLTSFVNGASSVINYPMFKLDTLTGSQKALKKSISDAKALHDYNLAHGLDDGFKYFPAADNWLSQAVVNTASLKLYESAFSKVYIKSDFYDQSSSYLATAENSDISDIKGVTYGTVSSGDTIESLALSGMGDSSLWKTLAEYNNLAYPYIYITDPNNPLDTQPEKTLGVGMSIAFPQFVSSNSVGMVLGKTGNGPGSLTYTFGRDLVLDENNDILFDSDGELVTVDGLDNLIQSIKLRLGVYEGELIKHIDYGLPNLLGYRSMSFIVGYATNALKSTIMGDSRIKDVTNMQVSLQDDVLTYACEVIPNFVSIPITLEGTIGGNA
jgi:hypothetical protein